MDDDVIGFYFHDVAHLDLAHHLPVIGDFRRPCSSEAASFIGTEMP